MWCTGLWLTLKALFLFSDNDVHKCHTPKDKKLKDKKNNSLLLVPSVKYVLTGTNSHSYEEKWHTLH